MPSVRRLVPLIAILAAACTEPGGTPTEPEFAKGGGNANPSAPEIAFIHQKGGIGVVAADGSGATRVLTTGTYPSWGNGGAGTAADPFRLVYVEGLGCGMITTAEIVIGPDGLARSQNVRSVPTQMQACRPRFSPDGARIVYHNDPGVKLVSTDGTGETFLYQPPPGTFVSGPVFSPDGNHVALIEYVIGQYSETSKILVLDLTGAVVDTLVRPGTLTPGISRIDWGVADELILSAGSTIFSLDLVNRTPPQPIATGYNPTVSGSGDRLAYTVNNNRDLTALVRTTGQAATIVRGYAAMPSFRK